MTLGLSHVHKARTVINSQYSNKDLLRFESSLAGTRHRDHRTYAEVLLKNCHSGRKKVCTNYGQNNTPVSDLTAPGQVLVDTVFNTSMVKNSIDSKHKASQSQGRHTKNHKTGVSVGNALNSDPINNCSESFIQHTCKK